MQCSAELSEPALDNQMSEIRYTPGPLAPELPLGSHISEFSSPCFTAVLSYSLIPARCWAPQHWATSRGTEGAQHPAGLSSGWVMSWVDASWSAVKFTEAWVFCQINASWGSYACPEAFFSVHVLLKKKKFYCKFCVHKLMFSFFFLFCPLWLLPSLLSCQESAPLCAEMPNSSQKLTRKDTFSHFLSKCLDTLFLSKRPFCFGKAPIEHLPPFTSLLNLPRNNNAK